LRFTLPSAALAPARHRPLGSRLPVELAASVVPTRSSYGSFHDDLELAVASLVTDESFDSASWNRVRLAEANSELWSLSSGGDADYEATGIGRMYASWYHLRRVRGAFEILRPRLLAERPIKVLDLGCGTGAVAWALGMLGLQVRYLGVDSSRPMLTWARGLWDVFRESRPDCDTVDARWIQGDAISSLLDGSLGDEADLVVMPFLLDSKFLSELRVRGTAWRACLEHMGVTDVFVWSSGAKLAWSRPRMETIMGQPGSAANPCGWYDNHPQCPILAEARAELSRRLELRLVDKCPAGIGISDTSGWHYPLRPAARPRNSISVVARRLGFTSPELLALCVDLGFEGADQFTMATSLTVGQLESIHGRLGRKLRMKEYAQCSQHAPSPPTSPR